MLFGKMQESQKYCVIPLEDVSAKAIEYFKVCISFEKSRTCANARSYFYRLYSTVQNHNSKIISKNSLLSFISPINICLRIYEYFANNFVIPIVPSPFFWCGDKKGWKTERQFSKKKGDVSNENFFFYFFEIAPPPSIDSNGIRKIKNNLKKKKIFKWRETFNLKMYLELHKRGIRDIFSLQHVTGYYLELLWSTKCGKGIVKMMDLEKAYFEYFLKILSVERLGMPENVNSLLRCRLKILVSSWIENNQSEVGAKDLEKSFDELWS